MAQGALNTIEERIRELIRKRIEIENTVLEQLGGTIQTGGPVAEFVQLVNPSELPKGVLNRSVFLDKDRKQLGEVVVEIDPEPGPLALVYHVRGRVFGAGDPDEG